MKRPGKYQGIISLGALLILAPGLIYWFTWRKTLRLWQDCRHLQKQMTSMQTDSLSLSDSLFSPRIPCMGEEFLLPRILPLTERFSCVVARYTPYMTRQEGNFSLHTDEFLLQGEYVGLLRVCEGIERQLPSCKIASLSYFLSFPNNRRQAPKLTLKLIIQYITASNLHGS